ncbi:MAG: aminotransferase class I/II-fold pyridoxal phosphate-dependent enzyme [Oscillospiraceae bacterium]|nr:aminotransferase class I/II-fold pyridoxal phosphate-dependent enzyme [Oscillospiraceae bacterium]
MENDYLNPKTKNFEPYSPNGGIDSNEIEIRLDANESYANLPGYIIRDIKESMEKIDFNRYPDPFARNLAKQYSKFLKAGENAYVDEKNIAAGNGSDELLNIIINAFLSKGDKILTFAPDFSMYAFYGDVIEAEVIKVQKNGADNFAIDFEKMEKKIREENIKLAVFSNPCNPTGQLESKKTLEKFIKNANCAVVLDEVYMSFADDKKNRSFVYDFLEYPNLIVMKSLSKAVGLASVRVGFALSNEKFINAIKTLKSPFNLNAVSQKIAETALCYPDYFSGRLDEIKKNKKNLQKSLQILFEGKKDFKIYETETNFVLIETPKSKDIFDFLLQNKILVRNLEGKFLRITTGNAIENEKLAKCLEVYNG